MKKVWLILAGGVGLCIVSGALASWKPTYAFMALGLLVLAFLAACFGVLALIQNEVKEQSTLLREIREALRDLR